MSDIKKDDTPAPAGGQPAPTAPVATPDENEVLLYGDVATCGHCKDANETLSEMTDGKTTKYRYVDVHNSDAKAFFKSKGIEPNQKVPIPYIRVCKTSVNPTTQKKEKKCGEVKEWKKDTWKSLENDKLPEEVSLSLEE
jgi:glutaredoxin